MPELQPKSTQASPPFDKKAQKQAAKEDKEREKAAKKGKGKEKEKARAEISRMSILTVEFNCSSLPIP